ncbi:hypothetical protein LY78DRAFT_85303 [Colletotrichum sublineola]|nr:hypothetical protein LY78DRAFT_85303 [Colletotrichum sublineola]
MHLGGALNLYGGRMTQCSEATSRVTTQSSPAQDGHLNGCCIVRNDRLRKSTPSRSPRTPCLM